MLRPIKARRRLKGVKLYTNVSITKKRWLTGFNHWGAKETFLAPFVLEYKTYIVMLDLYGLPVRNFVKGSEELVRFDGTLTNMEALYKTVAAYERITKDVNNTKLAEALNKADIARIQAVKWLKWLQEDYNRTFKLRLLIPSLGHYKSTYHLKKLFAEHCNDGKRTGIMISGAMLKRLLHLIYKSTG